MPTKTDRILEYLPGTFRALPPPTALHSFVDAFGRELLAAENSLAEVMQAHWVGYADRGADVLRDLVRFAALYGLAPRPEEEVEEFREHLLRYVRTFLEGTVTVQGALRIAAESLALHVEDRYAAMDTWWTRPSPELVTFYRDGADAASLVLGFEEASARGSDAAPAAVTGTVDLGGGADLSAGSTLRVATEGGDAEVDLAAGAPDVSAVPLDHIVGLIAPVVAAEAVDGRYLRIASRVTGPASSLTLAEGPGDAAEAVLGLPPRSATGGDPTGAALSSSPLPGGVDLSGDERYVRVTIDLRTREVDLGTGHRDLEELRYCFNTSFSADIASHDGTTLTLASPTTGAASVVSLDAPAAQDAAPAIFGATHLQHTGTDASRASLSGRSDLTVPADLAAARLVRLRVDGETRTVDVAGAEPAATSRTEIIDAINGAFDVDVASADGYSIAITSPTPGAASEVALEDAGDDDAGAIVFGIPPRTYRGTAAAPARVTGGAFAAADLMARHLLGVSVDGGPLRVVDLRRGANDPRAVTLEEVVAAINDGVFGGFASGAGGALVLTSPQPGAGGAVAVTRLTESRTRSYVTRAAITDEASQKLFGFVERRAWGTDGTGAVLAGDVDVSRGADVSESAYLRIAVDGGAFADVRCAGPRPRATLPDEVVSAVNSVWPGLASDEDGRIVLRSPSSGAASSVVLDVPRPGLDLLGLAPGLSRGTDPAGVRLAGAVTLSEGGDLPAGAAISVGVDGNAPVEVPLAPDGPVRVTLGDLVNLVNVATGSGIAARDVERLILTSPTAGAGSALELAVPQGTDVTEVVLGVGAPRTYRGRAATPAVVTGARSLAGTHDVTAAGRLLIAVDGGVLAEVDLAAAAADPKAATLDEIVAAFELAAPGIASAAGERIVLTSPTAGSGGRVELAPSTADDAREVLLGLGAADAHGTPALPAVLTGDAVIAETVDLTDRPVVRASIDGTRPVDVDAAGPAPWATSADEAASRLGAALAATVEVTPEGKLQITSASAGAASSVAIHALRHLEVVEFPRWGTRGSHGPIGVRHGSGFSVLNDSAGDELVTIAVDAAVPLAGPAFVNEATGWEARVAVALGAGARLELAPGADGRGVRATQTDADGSARPVRPELVTVAPPGPVARVPFDGRRRAPVTLDDPAAPAVVLLTALRGAVAVEVRRGDGDRFDVVVHGAGGTTESYAAVTIGRDAAGAESLERQLAERPSRLVTAEQLDKSTALRLVPGRSRWRYLDCLVSRFGVTRFDGGVFGIGPCGERGVFDVSRFAGAREAAWWRGGPGAPVLVTAGDEDWDLSLFDSTTPSADAPAQVALSWSRRAPGTFEVNLPADLHPRFGARFNLARFSKPGDEPESYAGAVTEPEDDERFLATLIKDGHPGPGDAAVAPSDLVTASVVPLVPLGWSPVPMPFRKPRRLTLGGPGVAAQIYLSEEGLGGSFLKIEAKEEGAWGNDISVSARTSGPARFDVTVALQAARFENARAVVLGDPPPLRAADLAQPGRIGLLQAKAAGVHARATRDRSSGITTATNVGEGRAP
ncbi:MAG TPA: hypothetical protein VG318_16925 [Actinomycetota bacterium]|nr:hypothetical protein [Actinomycetota bacterium]